MADFGANVLSSSVALLGLLVFMLICDQMV